MGLTLSSFHLDVELKKVTGYKEDELRKLHERFLKLDVDEKNYLTRGDFLRINELAINPLGDRIVHLLFNHAKSDMIDFSAFAKILAIFRPIDDDDTNANAINSKKNKIQFLFRLFDLDGDTVISTPELANILQMVMGSKLTINQVSYISKNMMFPDASKMDRILDFKEFLDTMVCELSADDLSIPF